MYSFVTVDKHGVVTRVIQEVNGAYFLDTKQQVVTCYYVNVDGYVEFDGSAHTFSAEWLAESIGRWTSDGGVIRAW